MIKANELRLGNLILNRHNEIDIVADRTFQDFRYPKMDGDYGYRGITLTEEWLLKAGFNKQSLSGMHNCFVIKRKNNYHFTLYESENSYNINNRMLEVDIKYVHQLQNIYFALTGEELVFSN